ncbi:MAG TPA: hypothetical protein VF491_05190 [Vicinamibacterales bacterium]
MANISGSSLAARFRAAAIVVAVLTLAPGVFTAGTPRFYPDDPLWVDDDASLDASGVAELEDANSYDFVVNTMGNPGERRDIRAMNVNTLDEVPDSSWFTNRIGRMRLPTADLVRGPDRVASVSLDGWVVSSGKSTGVQPGFRMTDQQGHLHQIEFDPPSNPELATGAEIIGTAFYHAFGYNTVDVYLAELDPARLVISPTATQFDPLLGERRRLTRRDIDNVLRRAARQPNGKYRVLVSRFADGKPLGNFRYYGTRPDDPNDIVAHEHRRELRGSRVFGAWLNHDDSRGVNSLDMLVTDSKRPYVKHYMFDFGSIMGSGTVYPQRHRPGNEYILEWKPGWLTLATLGLYARPWTRISYPEAPPAAGRFEAEFFSPEQWKPEYPNPAFYNMRPDDAFWAARIVAQFDAEIVRALVEKAHYSDPRTVEYLTHTLMRRREKVLNLWLSQVNPLIDFEINAANELTFANVAEREGLAPPAERYRLEWGRFDNATGAVTDALAVVGGERRLQLPAAYVSAPPEYLQVRVSAEHPRFPAWAKPVTVHFRRAARGWTLVGLNRLPET